MKTCIKILVFRCVWFFLKILSFFKSKNVEIELPARNGDDVTIIINGNKISHPNLIPLLDGNDDYTGMIGYYSKGSIDYKFLLKVFPYADLIMLASSGPAFKKDWMLFKPFFKAVFAPTMNCNIEKRKHLNVSYTMVLRSCPYNGLFWENTNSKFEYDYSILTWVDDDKFKRWDRSAKLIPQLSERSVKGIIHTQRKTADDMIFENRDKYIKSGLVTLSSDNMSEDSFNNYMSKAAVGIFPNTIDALPKHMIECLLANKRIVISKDLLFGHDMLVDLGSDIVMSVDFEEDGVEDKITAFIKSEVKRSPRNVFLDKYGVDKLSMLWAKEFNMLFGTTYKHIYPSKHYHRVKEYKNIYGDFNEE
tara:strand:- start:3888 stop:4973 length:1086 start_codon:yes stop_codon:yes gene_type:complete